MLYASLEKLKCLKLHKLKVERLRTAHLESLISDSYAKLGDQTQSPKLKCKTKNDSEKPTTQFALSNEQVVETQTRKAASQ